MLSVFAPLCYISAIALGSLGETVRGVFHREKHTLSKVGQTEKRVLLAEGVLHNEIFHLYYILWHFKTIYSPVFEKINGMESLPVNIYSNGACRYE